MGTIKNQAIVVSGHSEPIKAAHAEARRVFAEFGLDHLVCNICEHGVNGDSTFAAFLISPDGSKEKWNLSHRGDGARDKYVAFLRHSTLNWAVVVLGGDARRFEVEESPVTFPEPPTLDLDATEVRGRLGRTRMLQTATARKRSRDA